MSSQPFTQTLVESKGKAPVVISLFGAFEFSVNGAVVTGFRSNKTRALLAYLLLTRPQPVLRTTLIDLLWPAYTDKSAQSNLRQTLLNLRNLLAPFGLLKSDRKYVQLYNDPALLWCDAQRFTTLLDACHQHEHRSLAACSRCRSQIQVAVALYQGALLENFPATDSEPFNRWLQSQRAHFAEAFTEAQTTLTTAGRQSPLPVDHAGRSHGRADQFGAQNGSHHLPLCEPGGAGGHRQNAPGRRPGDGDATQLSRRRLGG